MALTQNALDAIDGVKVAMALLTVKMNAANDYRSELTVAERATWDALRAQKAAFHDDLRAFGHSIAPGVVPQSGGS